MGAIDVWNLFDRMWRGDRPREWTTRIAQSELAARNRRARFPAAPRVGTLRVAPAGDLLLLVVAGGRPCEEKCPFACVARQPRRRHEL